MKRFAYLPMRAVYFGDGALGRLPAELDELGVHRVLVVSSPSVRAQPLVERAVLGLGVRVVATYEGVRPHVPYDCLQPAMDLLHEHRPDAIVGIGAGSVMDAARALALAAGEGVRHAADLARWRATLTSDGVRIPATSGRAVPVVAIPTTLSAAEFANCAAVTSPEQSTKDLLIADEITPRTVLLDPQLATTTPVDIWSSTGMRALDHAIETVYSPFAGPVTDALALDAIRRLPSALRAARQAPEDPSVREAAQVAAWESYFGEMNLTLGLSHAIGHQIGAKYGAQHGWTTCAVLPTVMRWLAPETAPQQARIAEALGVRLEGGNDADAAAAAAVAVEQLVADLGLPGCPRELGVAPNDYEDLEALVLADPVVLGSPRPVAPGDVVELLRRADADSS